MPKTPPAAAPVAAPAEEEMTLDEFCQRRSQSDNRVELLAAFYSVQSRTSLKATESVYAARLTEFANQPV